MRAGGFPGNPGGLVVSIVKTAGGRAPVHHARGRGRSTWRPTERSRRCSDGTAGRRQRRAGGWTARSRRVSEYRRSGGIEPTRPRGGKGAPAGGTGGGKDGQHTEVGSRLHVTTTDSRTGQISLGDGGGHRLASWTSGYATARSEAICRGAGCGRTRTSGSVGGQGQQRPWSTRPPRGRTWAVGSRVSVDDFTDAVNSRVSFPDADRVKAGAGLDTARVAIFSCGLQPRRRARCVRTLPRPTRRRGDGAEYATAGRHLAASSGKFPIVREPAGRYK